MDDKKKEELREIADEFDFLRELILMRTSSEGDKVSWRRSAEQIAGRIIAARRMLPALPRCTTRNMTRRFRGK